MKLIKMITICTCLFTLSQAEYSYPMEGAPVKVAPVLGDGGNQSSNNVIKSINSTGINSRTSDSEIKTPGRVIKLEGYDEAIFEQMEYFDSLDVPGEKGKSALNAFNVILYQKKISDDIALAEAEKEKLETLEIKKKKKIRYAQGYCYLSRDILVERLATYAYFECDFSEPIGKAKLAVSMVPEFYAKAIIANPLYVVTKDNKRMPISSGVVMTKDKNSINLANIINDRLLEKIIVTSGYKGVGVFAKQAQSFLDAKSAARYSQTSTTTGGLTPVVIQDTRIKQPRIEDYFATATVQLVSELTKIIGENMVKNLPYTFKINKGNVFFADLEFADDGKMEGYKINQENIVKREPAFNDGLEEEIEVEVIPVKNQHNIGNTPGSTSTANKNIAPPSVK